MSNSILQGLFSTLVILKGKGKSIDDKVGKAPKAENKGLSREEQIVNAQYAEMEKRIAPIQARAPKPTAGSRMKAGFKNIANITRNIYDSTIGYGIAQGQNWKTARELKKNPGTEKDIVYLINGICQNIGSQHRYAAELRKQGLIPYHIKVNHGKSRAENAEGFYTQAGNLHKKTRLKDVHKRTDAISGHSSGGDLAIYLAGDKRIKQYGINPVSRDDKETIQARAPAPYGLKPKTLPQKIVMHMIPSTDNLYTPEGKRNAVEMYNRETHVPITIHAGLNDRLVTPEVAYERSAKEINVIDHPDSTHFGTSGGNPNMNRYFANRLAERHQKKLNAPAEERYAYAGAR